MKLIFEVKSVLKAGPVQSSSLTSDQLVGVEEGRQFQIIDEPYKIEGLPGVADDHFLVRLDRPPSGFTTETRWCVYCPHVTIEGTEQGNNPQDDPMPEPPPASPLSTVPIIKELPSVKWGPEISRRIPGISKKVRLKQPIFVNDPELGTANFTWGEATHGGTRIPADRSVTYNIVKIARVMQKVRKKFDNVPIRINSWYRDPATNRRVGGASRSRHLSGDAVDFVVKGVNPSIVYAELEPWWGNEGGLASSSIFTHIDARGWKARWQYSY